jgi:transcriptional regulator with XRE-family HTH domain
VAEPPVTFAGLLRTLRVAAQLTQEELAEASGVRPRTVSDLERGVATTPQRETIRRLADALDLTGPARKEFEAIARGRAVPAVPAGATGAAAATRTLPRDVASFTGRHQELRELAGIAAGAADAGGIVSIHAIGGMAGIGKTAFAVHAAHRLADQFPGGQIFLSLHGHTPGHAPVAPADALASLLGTVGVPAAQIPAGLEARMALWRDRLAEQQLLLILDDAASSEQVLPLLPGGGGSLVLVTSRRHLSALDDATALELARAIESAWDEAHALAGLGRCARATGHAGQAQILLCQALEIFQRIGAAEAPELLAELEPSDLFTSRGGQRHRRRIRGWLPGARSDRESARSAGRGAPGRGRGPGVPPSY